MSSFNLDKMRNAAEDALGAAKGRIGDETEKNVYEAINNKNWGASGSVLSDIARDTDKFAKIFKIVWEAGDSSPRNWRKIFKALMLAEYLVKNGCERCVDEIRDHSFRLRQLQEFNYYEERVDRGQGVREKAKQIIELLADNEQIREKREESKKLRDKFVGHGSISQAKFGGHGSTDSSAGGSGYSDSGGGYSGGGGGYSDKSDAPGRYSEPEPEHQRETMSEAVNDGPLRLKPKTKSVPRIKMKSDKKKEGAPVPPVDDDAGLAAAEEPDLFDAFADDDAPAGAFDPRGANGGGFADFGSAPQPFAAQFSAPAFEPQYAAAAPQAYAQQPQFADFDAAPAPAQPAQPAQQRMMGGFSDFSSAPAYAQQPTYSQAPPAQPMQPMQPMQPIGGMQPMGGMMQQGYAPQMMQQQPPPQQSYGQSGQSEDFGDFAQSAPPPQRLPQYDAPPAKKAGLDSLVSLDGLSLNTTRSPQAAPAQPRHGGSHGHHAASPQYGRGHSPQDSAAAHAAFTGLDGFTTSQQSMIATPQAQRMPAQQQGYAPQQGYAAQAPMQQYGSPQAQQAYGAPPPQMMGGYMQQQMPQQQQMPPQQMYGQQPQYGQQQQQQYGQQQPW